MATVKSEDILYSVHGSSLTAIADQVRRISKTEEAMTLDQMATNLLNVVPGGGLPEAESGTFGANDASIELGFSIKEGYSVSKYAGYDVYYGTTYKAREALAILGVRVFSYQIRTISVYLWDANSNLVGQVDNVTTVKQGYTDVYFSNPANVAMGEEFTISLSNHTYGATISPNYITMNSKITFVLGGKGSSNPPVSPSYEQNVLYGIGCPILGTISTVELPDEYQIARSTLDDIANEVKRITGTTGKITIDTMLTALQGIEATS